MIGRGDKTCLGEVEHLILIAHLARNACEAYYRGDDPVAIEANTGMMLELKKALDQLDAKYWRRP